MICTCCYSVIPKCFSLPYAPQTFLPLKESTCCITLYNRFRLLSCTRNIVLILEHLVLSRNHKGHAHWKASVETHGYDQAHLSQAATSMLLPQGLHLAGSLIIQIQLLDPPISTPKAEQTSNQPQEYWLKPELFSRTSVVKPRTHRTEWLAEAELL